MAEQAEDFLRRLDEIGTGAEDRLHPGIPQRLIVLRGDHAPGDDLDVGTSGIAQVLLLQYVEGLPRARVGWGRTDAVMLRRLGALHAALFAVFTHSPYMAAHQAAMLGRAVLRSLNDGTGPRFDVLMGHDTNVTALAAALRIALRAPGYATNDVPPGGALMLESLRDPRSGRSFVRVSYRTQPPGVLRGLGRTTNVTPLIVPGCGSRLCPAAQFAALLEQRLAPLVDAGAVD